MRLFEILGNDEDEVFAGLEKILRILKAHKQFSIPPSKPSKTLIGLANEANIALRADTINLVYWVSASKRVADVYTQIKHI
jgi:hypothetical protein